MRVLLTGWFSFDWGEVTAGDLLSRDTVAGWLQRAGVPFDMAVGADFRNSGDVDLEDVEPGAYTDLVFVCGPASSGPVADLMARFAHCRRTAIGVSVVDDTPRLGDVTVLARDSPDRVTPDLSLWTPVARTPVVGMILAHDQPEYGDRQRHRTAHEALERLVADAGVAPVPLDTRLSPRDAHVCATPAQFESALARMDAVVTTRLHGLVLSLKAGIPVVAVDPIAGGAKVLRQAEVLGWDAVQCADALDEEGLREQLAWCLSGDARARARACVQAVQTSESPLASELMGVLRASATT